MDNKIDFNDLRREKQELDAFLSTITEESLPIKGAVQTKEAISSLVENKSGFEDLHQEPSGSKLEKPAVKPEDISRQFAPKDKVHTQSINEFMPKVSDVTPLEFADKKLPKQEKTSSFLPLDEKQKQEVIMPKVIHAQGVKPMESFKTMTRFDGTTKSDEQGLTVTPPQEEKKVSTEIETEKKIDKTSPYDFTPEKKSTGTGKWVWILIILMILLFAGYFSKSYMSSFFKTNQGAVLSSVKEVKLNDVRQRRLHSVQSGKSIRVIEGTAENLAPYPISKIKVVANLYDSKGSVLASMESFGGNIIIDKQLESLNEAQLFAVLKEGKASEDQIPPKGQVPFMIIFTDEPAGVYRLSVMPVDFKKQ